MVEHQQFLNGGGAGRAHGIFLRSWSPVGPVRAEVVLTHGRGEHSGRYAHVAAALTAQGVRLWAYDLRGHGRSGGARGDVPSYAAFLDDLAAVTAVAGGSGRPVFMFGHSLGGQITLNYLLERPRQEGCVGAVVASPYLRLAYEPAWWRVALAGVVLRWWPAFTLSTALGRERLSRDLGFVDSLADAELMHDLISARMFDAVQRGAARALAGAERLELPLLLLHGAADQVTSAEATREFYGRLKSVDKQLVVYPELRHETHNDLGREQVIGGVLGWLEARLAAG